MHIHIINQNTESPLRAQGLLILFGLLKENPEKITILDETLKEWECATDEKLFSVVGLPRERHVEYLRLRILVGESQVNLWMLPSGKNNPDIINAIASDLKPINNSQQVINILLAQNYPSQNIQLPVVEFTDKKNLLIFIIALSQWLLNDQEIEDADKFNILEQLIPTQCWELIIEKGGLNPQEIYNAYEEIKQLASDEKEEKEIPDSFWQPVDTLAAPVNKEDCPMNTLNLNESQAALAIKNPHEASRLNDWFNSVREEILKNIKQNTHKLGECFQKRYEEIINKNDPLILQKNEIESIYTPQKYQTLFNEIERRQKNLEAEQKENLPINLFNEVQQKIEQLEQRMFQAVNTIKRTIPERNIVIPAALSILLTILFFGIPLFLTIPDARPPMEWKELKMDLVWLGALLLLISLFAVYIYKKEKKKIESEINALKNQLQAIQEKLTKLYEAHAKAHTLQMQLNILLQLKEKLLEHKQKMEVISQKKNAQMTLLNDWQTNIIRPLEEEINSVSKKKVVSQPSPLKVFLQNGAQNTNIEMTSDLIVSTARQNTLLIKLEKANNGSS
ncbi:hypothetical protein Calab_3164 [Caldithrix abyssi DSM 13497]|uniref:Uncharacterized protein n=1 Tax=Caldithrix abyssi DSM 13497 TaxID=880073 RepID=H1XUE4_CALAY|nr:hypothetical protein [Caldithrix abyssi]APF18792.1 hypothetical protein Cabys_2043 [Caldithrix abyssi DSM 13497]EHO42770.1 hypothetical protein Calab_3164 [Caldithrix abyssi DSM 13497]